mmetsp:Transcript_9076/g.17788  ORF Transcript_9076/g.17788 Transcript_9076/m.17788 type:complete len:217 (+) Transcript_9076:494-1144(+)
MPLFPFLLLCLPVSLRVWCEIFVVSLCSCCSFLSLFFFCFAIFDLVLVLLFVLFLLLLLLLLFLLFRSLPLLLLLSLESLLVVNFVGDQVVHRNHRPHNGADIHGQFHVVGLQRERLPQLVLIQVGQQVEDILKIVENLRVGRQFPCQNVPKILSHLLKFPDQRVQRNHFLLDPRAQRESGGVLDVPKQMLYSDLLSFKRLDCRGYVHKRPSEEFV